MVLLSAAHMSNHQPLHLAALHLAEAANLRQRGWRSGPSTSVRNPRIRRPPPSNSVSAKHPHSPFSLTLRAVLHLEAGPNPLEADCMKFQPFLGWRPASTTHYNKIITGANFPICKGLRVKKLGRSNKSSIIQRI
jgi:hypothetical protein